MKFFRAVHKEIKEVIEFGLEDVRMAFNNTELLISQNEGEKLGYQITRSKDLSNWLKDYDLYYNHLGGWYPYIGEVGI